MKEGKGHIPRSAAHTCWMGADLTGDIIGMWGKVQPKPKSMALGQGLAENLEPQHLEGEEGPWLWPVQG